MGSSRRWLLRQATHSSVGRSTHVCNRTSTTGCLSAWNRRFAPSFGRGALLSLMVVRTTLPSLTPRRPRRRISRSAVQRATASPSRFICFQILSARRPQIRVSYLLDLGHPQGASLRPVDGQGAVAAPGSVPAIGRPGNLQDLADRLDPVRITPRSNELVHHFSRRSSSA